MHLLMLFVSFHIRNVMRALFGTTHLMEVDGMVFNNSDDDQDNGNGVSQPFTI